MQYKCEICDKGFDSLWGLSNHNVRKHDTKPKETYIKYVLDKVRPTCQCGCSEEPTFLGIRKGFRDYIRGHASRVNNNWGHNVDAQKKSKDTQRKMYESGELVIWNKGITKEDDERLNYGDKISSNLERSKKISKALKGRKMSKDVMNRLDKGMRDYWSKEVNREKQRLLQSKRINKNHKNHKSQLEKRFELILLKLKFSYIPQYMICGYNFDFYLPKHDLVIEVDGDFFHCNPKKYPKGPIYESQINTIKNDKIKNNICEKSNGLMLLRFWESDINNRPEWVKSELLKHIS
jgi:very-short-patch-repair endonuclease